jgi:hypothetical protein
MSKLSSDFNNMKNDLQFGANRVGEAIKNTANELKYDAQDALHTMNNKSQEFKEDILEMYEDSGLEYKVNKQINKIKKHM